MRLPPRTFCAIGILGTPVTFGVRTVCTGFIGAAEPGALDGGGGKGAPAPPAGGVLEDP